MSLEREKQESQGQSEFLLFSSRSGSLMEKTVSGVGVAGVIEVSLMTLRDLLSEDSYVGLQLATETRGEYETERFSTVLDGDEVVALMSSLDVLRGAVFASAPTDYTEVSFTARSGFEAGAYYSKGAWKTYLNLEPHSSDALVFMNQASFSALYDVLVRAALRMEL